MCKPLRKNQVTKVSIYIGVIEVILCFCQFATILRGASSIRNEFVRLFGKKHKTRLGSSLCLLAWGSYPYAYGSQRYQNLGPMIGTLWVP
jgi:hypothetical protein